MGSLLKEYLDTRQKQEEVLIGSETNKEIIDSEAKGLQNAEESSGLNTEESSSHDLEYGREETENQIEKGPSENGNRKTMRQQFKNVVCIVDPPRVGLHPVVSCILCNMFIFCPCFLNGSLQNWLCVYLSKISYHIDLSYLN